MTGRWYVGSCENQVGEFRRHNAGDSKTTKQGAAMGPAPERKLFRELRSSTTRAILPRPAEVEMMLTSYRRPVAATAAALPS